MRCFSRNGSGAALAAGLALLCASAQAGEPPCEPTKPVLLYSKTVPLPQDAECLPAPGLPPGPPHTLNLFLNPGSVAGTGACGAGTGDRVCGLYFEIRVDGDLSFPSGAFASQVGGQLSQHVHQELDEQEQPIAQILKVALLTTANPLPVDLHPLGLLTLQGGTHGGNVNLLKLETVDPGLTLNPGDPRTIAVPEPGFALGLGCALAALALLSRLRWRRGALR